MDICIECQSWICGLVCCVSSRSLRAVHHCPHTSCKRLKPTMSCVDWAAFELINNHPNHSKHLHYHTSNSCVFLWCASNAVTENDDYEIRHTYVGENVHHSDYVGCQLFHIMIRGQTQKPCSVTNRWITNYWFQTVFQLALPKSAENSQYLKLLWLLSCLAAQHFILQQ